MTHAGGAINGQVILWDLRYRPEDNLGLGQRPAASTDNTAPMEFLPAVISVWPELYNIPPSIPTDVFSKKTVSSHRNAVQAIKFLPKAYELDKRFNLQTKEASKLQ